MELIRKVKGKIAYWRRTIIFYGISEIDVRYSSPHEAFLVTKNLSDLKELNFVFDINEYINRFKQGHLFCCLTNGKKITASGWVNPNKYHTIGELALVMEMKKRTEVFYDFTTIPVFRGKGLYPTLLRHMINRNDTPKVIYVLSNNTASIRGIEKADFQKLGSINGYNKKTYRKLLSVLWQD